MEAPCPAWNAGYARQSGLASALTRMLALTGGKIHIATYAIV